MEHSAAIVMNHCDCEAEQMMDTGNEETVATKPKEITATAKQSR